MNVEPPPTAAVAHLLGVPARGPARRRGWRLGVFLAMLAAMAPATSAQDAPAAAPKAPADPAAAPPTVDAVDRLLYGDAARFLTASDAVVRGEAALVLASAGDPRRFDAILAVARDPDPAAQLRGILALGYLGEPAAVGALEALLTESNNRVRPRGVAAAFALGLLPDQAAAAAVANRLLHSQEANQKRQRDVTLALLVALASRAPVAQKASLLQLHADDSLRDPTVRSLLVAALARVPGAIAPTRLPALLAAAAAEERRALLAAIAAGQIEAEPHLTADLERLATRDRDASVRAAALAALTRLRHLPALDLAVRAIRGGEPIEVEQGVRTAQQLGGAPMRRAIERQLDYLGEAAQRSLLVAFTGPVSDEFQATLLHLAADPRTAPDLADAAALTLAQAACPAAEPVLRRRFVAASDAAALLPLARALLQIATEAPPLTELTATPPRGDAPPDGDAALRALALDGDRLTALLLAGHPQASRLCSRQLQQEDLPVAVAQTVLTSVRRSRLGAVDTRLRAALPEPVRSLVP